LETPKRSHNASRFVALAGECVARQRERVDEIPVHRGACRQAAVLELAVEEGDVERRIVDDPLGVARKLDDLVRKVAELRLALQIVPCLPVDFRRAHLDVALRIEVQVQRAAGRPAVDELEGRELDDAVTQLRVEARRFGVDYQLAHAGIRSQKSGIRGAGESGGGALSAARYFRLFGLEKAVRTSRRNSEGFAIEQHQTDCARRSMRRHRIHRRF
jgi:hypothetical protein